MKIQIKIDKFHFDSSVTIITFNEFLVLYFRNNTITYRSTQLSPFNSIFKNEFNPKHIRKIFPIYTKASKVSKTLKHLVKEYHENPF